MTAAQLLPGLERKLKAEITGDVMFDRFSRGRYATDASHYQMMPLGVVVPRTVAEAERTIALAREEGVSVLARGGGTSQSGQTVNSSLVVDCSKHLTNLLELDIGDTHCTVEPGVVLDDLNRKLKPYGLWFPVDVSTPGSTVQCVSPMSSSRRFVRCFEQSTTSEEFTVWPDCEVPPPRASTLTPSSRASAIVRSASATVRGTTTPRGIIC